MNERIKEIRRILSLTQVEFGNAIGVRGNTIATYEAGIRNPSEAIIIAICREFHVDEQWLKTGVGEMFPPENPDEEFDRVCTQIQLSDDAFIKELLKIYWGLSDDHKRFVKDKIIELSDAIKKERQ